VSKKGTGMLKANQQNLPARLSEVLGELAEPEQRHCAGVINARFALW
jgi:hypothetical protein